jgi:hypothetical protein
MNFLGDSDRYRNSVIVTLRVRVCAGFRDRFRDRDRVRLRLCGRV